MIESIHHYAWLIPVLPSGLALSLGLGFLSIRRAMQGQRGLIAVVSIATLIAIMILSMVILWSQLQIPLAHQEVWAWLDVGDWFVGMGYLLDPLSALMLVVVTTVAVAVLVYTHGYMAHDQGYGRFFVYLTLFTASMLGLVLSPNLVQLYICWELVGMCSYLLVGFWCTRPSAAYACQKAFVTNRIGDCGLLLGILGLYWLTGDLNFQTLVTHLPLDQPNLMHWWLPVCCFALFLGPIAKSAQFPLHVWLPDAMEGPTPISALIHAATMVAAGIFLVARLLPVLAYCPSLMDVIAYTGTLTALLGATLALGQQDLKKGLAYSTMSQLGYMMLALGLGAYPAALFHLLTHAYSKALLFLGAGSVMHAIEPVVGYHPYRCQNMLYMGGLRHYLPRTAYTFLLGTLSLCGIPPLACFWSKDEILAEAWERYPILGWIAWLTAGLTAFYMFRIYWLTFEGEFRGYKLIKQEALHPRAPWQDLVPPSLPAETHPHEANWSMVMPLIVLSVPTAFLGLLGAPLPNGTPHSSLLAHWLTTNTLTISDTSAGWSDFIFQALPSVTIGLTGAFVAWLIYGRYDRTDIMVHQYQLDPPGVGWVKPLASAIMLWSLQRGYIDAFYERTVLAGTRALARQVAWLDQWGLDSLVNTSGLAFLLGGESTRYTTGGRIPSYALVLMTGISLLLGLSLGW